MAAGLATSAGRPQAFFRVSTDALAPGEAKNGATEVEEESWTR